MVEDAFETQGMDRSFGRVTVSDRADLAQFQCSGAMGAAKAVKKNPREVAAAIIEELHQRDNFSSIDTFEKMEIAGPGFINFTLTDKYIANHLRLMQEDDHYGVRNLGHGAMVLLDYGGPNIAKAMHVAHLRSAVIGESVWRTLVFCGYKALGDVHMGDWGTHMGMLINDYLTNGEQDVVLKADLKNQDSIDAVMNDMAERYPRAATAARKIPILWRRRR